MSLALRKDEWKGPSVSLCVIAKNEESNMDAFIKSTEGLFEEVIFVDTGSTDKTKEMAQRAGFKVFDFEWVHDFSAARNFSFSKATSEFIMWLDLDDIILEDSKKAFLEFKRHTMSAFDYWLAPYDYAKTADGKVACEFLRERVVRRSKGFTWRFFLHEGLTAPDDKLIHSSQVVRSWRVTHNRTQVDLQKDKGRNLSIIKKNLHQLNARMTYYYGKELFDAQDYVGALDHLRNAVNGGELEKHDKTLAMQYLGATYYQLGSLDRAMIVASAGMVEVPQRAEFYSLMGDCFFKMARFKDAIPYYTAALACENGQDAKLFGAIFTAAPFYNEHPKLQLTQIEFHLGRLEEGLRKLDQLSREFPGHPKVKEMMENAQKLRFTPFLIDQKEVQEVPDLVLTAPFLCPKVWDREVLDSSFLGGSETAAILLMEEFKKLYPERRVVIFNERAENREWNGVEYLKNQEIPLYFSKYKPALHIAWRHTTKFTNAKTVVWCHDLLAPGLENVSSYEKVIALSPFHKNFLQSLMGLPEEKIYVSRNALDLKERKEIREKEPLKLIYSSSPDRGLFPAIKIMDEVVKVYPEAKLHVFYGLDNLRFVVGQGNKPQEEKLLKELEKVIAEKPYIVFRGGVSKEELYREMETSSIWLYPTQFLETFCISALEMLAHSVWPVTRNYGAIASTIQAGDILTEDPDLVPEMYAERVIAAIKEKKWEELSHLDLRNLSWRDVALEWKRDLLKEE